MNQSKRIDPLLKRAQELEDAVARDLAERQRHGMLFRPRQPGAHHTTLD